MSLLLQALKQIESKPPAEERLEPAPGDPGALVEVAASKEQIPEQTPEAHEGPVAERQAGEATSATVVPATAAESRLAPADQAIELMRRYDESETVSALAFAAPLELEHLPLFAPGDGPLNDDRCRFAKRHRLAEEVVGLLPDESRGVIALVSASGRDGSAVVFDIGEELAALTARNVLVIHAQPAASMGGATFSDAMTGRASWRHALVQEPGSRLGRMPRGAALQAGANSRGLYKLWDEIGEEFSFVLFDLGGDGDYVMPILATCDAAFITVRLNDTHRSDTERLLAAIRGAGCQPCGCLVVGT
ncbi:MAG TPA: hypothetical protein VFI31_25690 [Pirellulales bacterium]|nr:hypothetical protein [Pirellulales bacterium]